MKEIRRDLYTQTEYAKKIGVSKQRVYKMIKDNMLKVVEVNGTVLVKSA